MTKIVLSDVGNLIQATSAATTINDNSAIIAAAWDNNLSRDGTEPNEMQSDLDMNSNHILNLPQPINYFEPLRLIDAATLNGGGTIPVDPLPPGGNTNQALVKNSNTSLDAGWKNVTPLVNTFTSLLSGAVPASGGGTAKFIRADGNWAVPAGSASKYNVLDYGFVSDGITDNYAAWVALMALLPAAGGDIYFPTGVYSFVTSPTHTFPTSASQIHISGDGPDGTRLLFPSSYGLQFTYTSPQNSVIVENLSILTGTVGGNIGLSILYPTATTNPHSFTTSLIRNVQLRGSDNGGTGGNDYWTYGFYIHGPSGTNITDCTVWGGVGAGEAIVYEAPAGCISVQHNLINFSASNVLDGVLVGTSIQGLQILNSNFITAQDGIQVVSGGGALAEISIIGCQFTCSNYNVNVLSPVLSLNVQDNPYMAGTNGIVNIENIAVTGNITNNYMIPNVSLSGVGITAKGPTSYGGIGTLVIAGNNINNFATAISLTSTADSVVVGWNTGSGNTTYYSNAGTNNILPTGTGSLVQATSPTLITPVLGTPTSVTLTNATGLPISTGVSGLASGIATFLATPTSSNLKTAVTDETGSGALVFANTPTLVTPVLGAATATSINGLALTSSTGTFTLTNSKTLSVSNTLTFTGTDGSSVAFGTGGTVLYGNQSITLSGDITGSGATSITTTLATVNSNVGTFGTATQVPQITVNGKGLVTAVTNVTITPAVGSITGLGTGVATALAVNIGTSGSFVTNGGALGTPSSGVATNLTGTASSLTAGTVTTNANLTGAVTSVGNATSLGSFTSANLSGALTDETGSGSAVFGTSPILSTVDARGTWTTGSSWTLPAHTLGGTVSGGGNNINNVIVGAVTPLAGTFTTLSTSGPFNITNNNNGQTAFSVNNNSAGGGAYISGDLIANNGQLSFIVGPAFGSSAIMYTTVPGELRLSSQGTGGYTTFYSGTGGTERMRLSAAGGLSVNTTTDAGVGNLLLSGILKYTGAATAVSGAGPFLTGSGSTLNSRVKVNFNGTDYWIPCSTTAF